MPTLPSGLKVAQSYMNDVEKQLKELWDYPNPVGREQMAEKILKGDLALARKEIEKAGESGSDKNAAMAYWFYIEGEIYAAVRCGAQGNIISDKWYKKAVESYTNSLQCENDQHAYYKLGLLHANEKKKAEAITAFQQAIQGSNEEIRIAATKEIGRVENEKSSGSCYIATACYGSYDHPDVQVFRRFRDEAMLPKAVGRLLVAVYYKVSPPLAVRLGHVKWLSSVLRRWFLEPLARKLR